MIGRSGEPAHAQQLCRRERERCSGEAQKHTHTCFRAQLARRQERGGKKQPDTETDCGGESDDDQPPPADPVRQVQADREGGPSRDENAERLAENSGRS